MQLVSGYDLLIETPRIIRERQCGAALRTSALLLDSVKPHVISLDVTGVLNIHGKRLNIWINMHILCWHAHMDVHSIVPIGSANKKQLLCLFALFTLPTGK